MTTAFAIAFCGLSTSRSTPSMRKRTTRRFSYGSIWMSDAPSLTASVSSALISRMIGASSSLSSRSSGSGNSSASVLQIEPLVEIRHHRARIVALLVEIAQQPLELVRGQRREAQRRAEMAAQLGENLDAHAVAARDFGVIVAPAGQRDAVPARVAERRARRARDLAHGWRACSGCGRSGWPSSVGLSRKSCTSGSSGRCVGRRDRPGFLAHAAAARCACSCISRSTPPPRSPHRAGCADAGKSSGRSWCDRWCGSGTGCRAAECRRAPAPSDRCP